MRAIDEGAGPLVMCLHGFPDHEGSFAAQRPALLDAGYRVVCPRLRGYEPSSQPGDGDYSVRAHAGDVLAWLDALGAERAHLVGHDWGSVIAQAVARLAPARLLSLTIAAVPPIPALFRALPRHPRQSYLSWYIGLFQTPLAERALRRDDYALIERLWRSWSPTWRFEPGALEEAKSVFRLPGVPRAAIELYRQFARELPWWWRAPKLGVRTLALSGRHDGCIDPALFREAAREVEVHLEIDAGHFMHRERPERVNAALLEWLARGGAPSAAT